MVCVNVVVFEHGSVVVSSMACASSGLWLNTLTEKCFLLNALNVHLNTSC